MSGKISELQTIFKSADPAPFIKVSDENIISFQIQQGPVKEVGENGCQVDDMVLAARDFIKHHNQLFPCQENANAIMKLEEALLWLKARKDDRLKRGVEGYNKK